MKITLSRLRAKRILIAGEWEYPKGQTIALQLINPGNGECEDILWHFQPDDGEEGLLLSVRDSAVQAVERIPENPEPKATISPLLMAPLASEQRGSALPTRRCPLSTLLSPSSEQATIRALH